MAQIAELNKRSGGGSGEQQLGQRVMSAAEVDAAKVARTQMLDEARAAEELAAAHM
jgi:hypothetical protein